MFEFGLILGLIVGGGGGWGITYVYFRRKKITDKLKAEAQKDVAKLN